MITIIINLLNEYRKDFPVINDIGKGPKHPILEGLFIGLLPFIISSIIIYLVYKYC